MSATPYYRVDPAHTGELGREVRVFGPPGCLAGPTRIAINRAGKGGSVRLDRLVTAFNGGKPAGQGARAWDLTIPTYVQRAVGDTIRLGRLVNAWESGVKEVFLLTTPGHTIAATAEHPFLTAAGWARLGDLRVGDAVLVNAGQGTAGRGPKRQYADTYTRHHPRQRRAKDGFRVPTHRLTVEAELNGLDLIDFVAVLRDDPDQAAEFTYLTPDQTVHHRNHDHTDNRPENLLLLDGGQAEHAAHHGWGDNVLARVGDATIMSIRPVGAVETYDLEVADDPHCFVANGFVVHNTGKTTFLTGSVRNTALLRGPHNVVVASFTVTAARELQGRGLPLPKSQIGTLHSLAYRALDRPPVADEVLDDWNTNHPALALTVSGRKTNVDDGAPVEANTAGATEGDALASALDSLRARRVPYDKWPVNVRDFSDRWEDWKRAGGLIDFTDMIEHALEDVAVAPGRPDVGFFDEVQDFTPLELALIRKWGQHMERMVLAGDDDQCIYGFKGASPDAFLNPAIPDHDKIVLSQSWRVPSSVHAAAEHWIRQVGHREDKLYAPRDETGLVRRVSEHFQQPQRMVDLVEAALATTTTDADGTVRPATVMVLASCGYMLDPVKHELRKRGMPFHNPYRLTRGDWNPLRPARGVSSRERLLSYLVLDERHFGDDSRPWTGGDVKKWAHVVKKQGIFVRGAVGLIDALPDRELDFETELAPLFANEVELEQAVTPDIEWFARNLLAASRAGMQFPLEVTKKRGVSALIDTPRVVLGTIHSVKGGQADVVILVPDLSSRGSDEWRTRGVPQDGIRRQFYVGMTRARRELVVCAPATTKFVSPEQMVAGARKESA